MFIANQLYFYKTVKKKKEVGNTRVLLKYSVKCSCVSTDPVVGGPPCCLSAQEAGHANHHMGEGQTLDPQLGTCTVW